MSSPEVSVVMPVVSCDDRLNIQLRALSNQDYSGSWELIISLNTDDLKERSNLDNVLQSFTSLPVEVVDSSGRQSASHARNVGMKAARSDILVFCDSDDQVDSSWLTSMAKAVENGVAVGGHLEEKRLAISGQEAWRPPATPGHLPTFLDSPYLISANMGIHRTDFEQAGGFDTSLIRGEDIELSWSLADNGVRLIYEPDAIVHYRHRKGLRSMIKQHYLYGRGFSQLLSRRSVPGETEAKKSNLFRPNNQKAEKKGAIYLIRRGSIAVGRLDGLIRERASKRFR